MIVSSQAYKITGFVESTMVTKWAARFGTTVTAVQLGIQNLFVKMSDGRFHAFGYNSQKQLAQSDSSVSSTLIVSDPPVELFIRTKKISNIWPNSIMPLYFAQTDGCTYSVTIYGDDSPVLCNNSRIYTCGSGTLGQLGDGTTTMMASSWVKADIADTLAGNYLIDIKATPAYSIMALTSTGRLYGWGMTLFNNLTH